MTQVRDVFREALRLYPPVGFLARECAADTQMRDKRMPKGAAFATQETVLILSSLLVRYRFELPEGFSPKPVGRLTLHSENGMRMILKRRD